VQEFRTLSPAERAAAYLMAPVLYRDTLESVDTTWLGRARSMLTRFLSQLLNQNVPSFVARAVVPWQDKFPDRDTYVSACISFLLHGLDIHSVISRANGMAARIESAVNDSYRLSDPSQVIETNSFTSPELRFAKSGLRVVRELLDGSTRLVVKRYDIKANLEQAATGDKVAEDALCDLVTDMVITSGALNRLVLSYNHTITPHFAFQVDQFSGPSIEKAEQVGNGGKNKSRVMLTFKPDSLSQYVVVERADYTLADLISASTGSKKLPDDIVSRFDLLSLRSILFQIIYSAAAAWFVTGWTGNDTHTENFMVHLTSLDPESAYTGAALVYVAEPWREVVNQPRHFMIPAKDHRNLFVEIIDAGRARAFVSAEEPPGRTKLALFGNANYELYGIYPDGERLDRSWDMRRLGMDLMHRLSLSVLGEHGDLQSPEAETTRDLIRHAIGVMSNAPYLAWMAYRVIAKISAKNRTKVQQEYMKSFRELDDTAKMVYKRDMKDPTLYRTAELVFMNAVYKVLRTVIVDVRFYGELLNLCVWTDWRHEKLEEGVRSYTTADQELTAPYVLTLPLFEALAIEPTVAARLALDPVSSVVAGVIEQEDVLADPYMGEPNPNPTPNVADRLAKRLESRACYVCGRAGTGVLARANGAITQVASGRQPAFCAAECAHIYELLAAQHKI
jgi:hypothetical protein